MTSGQDTWSARCVETRTAGAAGGPGKPTGSDPGRAPRSDPTAAQPGLPLADRLFLDGLQVSRQLLVSLDLDFGDLDLLVVRLDPAGNGEAVFLQA